MNVPKSEDINVLKEQLKAKTNQCRQYQEEIAEYKQEVADLEKKIVQISVMDRWKIGEYLHDSLAQKLNYAKILINFVKKDSSVGSSEMAEQCNEILTLIDEGINEVRDLSHDLIPAEVGKEGINDAFVYLRDQIESRHQITCELEISGIAEESIHNEVVLNLYLIAQEAIKNAIAHGEADNVRVALFKHERQLYMHVKDDGKGFDPNEKGGIGLSIMAYRADKMGGTFRIRPAKEGEEYSTYVTCTVPLDALGG